MNAEEIRQAVNSGKSVFWKNSCYVIIKDSLGQYLIRCILNDNYIGLTHLDGTTLNGDEGDFYIGND
jgi:hypothetical protein